MSLALFMSLSASESCMAAILSVSWPSDRGCGCSSASLATPSKSCRARSSWPTASQHAVRRRVRRLCTPSSQHSVSEPSNHSRTGTFMRHSPQKKCPTPLRTKAWGMEQCAEFTPQDCLRRPAPRRPPFPRSRPPARRRQPRQWRGARSRPFVRAPGALHGRPSRCLRESGVRQ